MKIKNPGCQLGDSNEKLLTSRLLTVDEAALVLLIVLECPVNKSRGGLPDELELVPGAFAYPSNVRFCPAFVAREA